MHTHIYPLPAQITTGDAVPCEVMATIHFAAPAADPYLMAASHSSFSTDVRTHKSAVCIAASEPAFMQCSCRWPILYNNHAGEQALLDAESLTYLRTETGWHRSDCPALRRPDTTTVNPS